MFLCSREPINKPATHTVEMGRGKRFFSANYFFARIVRKTREEGIIFPEVRKQKKHRLHCKKITS